MKLSAEFFADIPVLSPLLRRFTVHPYERMFVALRSDLIPGWHRGIAIRD